MPYTILLAEDEPAMREVVVDYFAERAAGQSRWRQRLTVTQRLP